MLEPLFAKAITGLARNLTGARSFWQGCAPEPVQRIYFANHSSNVDFVLLWSALPPMLRRRTRPVAASDYWLRSRVRSYLINRVFRGVLIDRTHSDPTHNPVQIMQDALAEGYSLILFPEGQRNLEESGLLPFKSGLFHLATACPQVELVPVWINNLNRVMPKGRILPLPLLCTLTFGRPLHLLPNESKPDFLTRSRQALLDLQPEESRHA